MQGIKANLPMINDALLTAIASSFCRLGVFSYFNKNRFTILPGFCDVHVHFREPGFVYKESIKTGSMASACGGYTDVCTMPNLKPVPDSEISLAPQLEAIKKDAVIGVHPYGAITMGQAGGQLSRLLLDGSGNVVAFSDDGKGVQNGSLMLDAMKAAKEKNALIVAHCEDNSLLCGGYIHDGDYAKTNNHKGISSESEYKQIERDIELAIKTGVRYHVCHISTRQSVEIIRQAKADGVDITCETAPHYLILDDSNLIDDGKFKMNPPIRSRQDKEALLEGIQDGTIDMIATDHAPHAENEKNKGLKGSAFGIVGIETAFPLCYTHLVKKSVITLERFIELISINPRKRFGLPEFTGFSIWDLQEQYAIDSSSFLSKGKATPFDGADVYAKNYLTVYKDKIVYEK